MQIRRRHAALMAGFGAFLSIATLPIQAAQPAIHTEDSLLGIRLLDSYKSVLKKYGQPAEIQVGNPLAPEADAAGPGGGPGGMPGLPGSGGGGIPGSYGMPGGPGGMPGSYGAPTGGGIPGSYGTPGSGGLPGFGGPAGGKGGAPMMPGSSGAPGSTGTPGSNALPVIPGTGGGTSEETIWWYKWQQQGVFIAFLFNKQGQVIQIQSHGYKTYPNTPNARTSKGVVLGSSMGAILKNYGWSPSGDHDGEYVVMRFDSSSRVGNGHGRLAFQVLKNEVVGITLGFVK